jgi:glyoxylase I family protein
MPLIGSMNHVSITVGDLDNAMKFYQPFLEFLGYEIWDEIRDPNGQRLRVTVNRGNGAGLNIWEAKLEFAAHPFEVYEVGLHHIAFNTDTREQVDEASALVKRLGAQILDGPGEFPYDPAGWYAVYFFGPDQLKFEVVHHPTSVKSYAALMRLASRAMKST